jgi:exosome complex RNA-binding protein Rrp4
MGYLPVTVIDIFIYFQFLLAITQNDTIVCVGDINRQHGQFKRGGGTYCTQDSQLYNAFRTIITEVNSTCHGNRV